MFKPLLDLFEDQHLWVYLRSLYRYTLDTDANLFLIVMTCDTLNLRTLLVKLYDI